MKESFSDLRRPNASLTVLTAAYNGADYLDAFIGSALSQTVQADFLIRDDGSCDNFPDTGDVSVLTPMQRYSVGSGAISPHAENMAFLRPKPCGLFSRTDCPTLLKLNN